MQAVEIACQPTVNPRQNVEKDQATIRYYEIELPRVRYTDWLMFCSLLEIKA